MVTITSLFIIATTAFNLPPNLLSAICWVESKHDVNAIHYDDGPEDSLGICQVQLSSAYTVGFRGTAEELMKPEINTIIAGAILKQQMDRYHGDIKKAVIAYNLGHAGSLTTTKYQRRVYQQWRK